MRQRIQGGAGIRPQLGRIVFEEDAIRRGNDLRASLVVHPRGGVRHLLERGRRLGLLTAGEQAGQANGDDERTQRPRVAGRILL
jgi:hypothetical protein